MPTLVSRNGWNAREPQSTIHTTTWSRRTGFAIHHSAGPTNQTVRQIQNHQMDNNGWSDIGYNWLVNQNGTIFEGRAGGWLAIGAHAGGQNTAWIGVCWIGNSGNVAPSQAALTSIEWLYGRANALAGRRLLVSGHGQVPGQATECPGSRLRAWIANGMPTVEDDMELADRVDTTDGQGGRWSFGDIMERDSLSVNAALGYAAASDYRIRRQVLPELRAGFAKAAAERAALRAIIEGLAGRVQLTPEQVDQLAIAVAEAGDEAAREVLERLEAAGQALIVDDQGQ